MMESPSGGSGCMRYLSLGRFHPVTGEAGSAGAVEEHAARCVPLIDDYMTTSSLGQFQAHLELLRGSEPGLHPPPQALKSDSCGQARPLASKLRPSSLKASLTVSLRELISSIFYFEWPFFMIDRYNVTFVGMVLPRDELSVELSHTRMRNGNMVTN